MKIPDLVLAEDPAECPSCGNATRAYESVVSCTYCGIAWNHDGTNGDISCKCTNAGCIRKYNNLVRKFGGPDDRELRLHSCR